METEIARGSEDSFLTSRSFHILLIAVLALAVYGNSIFNKFNFDDDSILLGNPAVHGLSLPNLKAVFTSVPNSVEYLPVRDLTYMIDYQFWGLKALGYHLSNIIYFALACLALYMFLSKLLSRWAEDGLQMALFATMIFAVHPGHTESVASIAQRKDIMMGLFSFMSLWTFLLYKESKKGKVWYLVLSQFLFVCALLSKTLAAVVPLIVFLLNHIYNDEGETFRKRAGETALFFGVGLIITLINFSIYTDAGIIRLNQSYPVERIPTAARALFYYLRILFFPYPLKMWYDYSISESFFELPAILSIVAASITVALCFWRRKKWRVVSFSVAIYIVCALPVIGLLPTSSIIAERYLFLPSVGFALALAWAFLQLKKIGHTVHIALFLVLLSVYSFLTVNRNFDWENMETLLVEDLRTSPDSLKLRNMLGRYHFRNRRYKDAFRYFSEVKKMKPENIDYEFFLAIFYFELKQYNDALSILDNIGGRDINLVDIHYIYGRIYQATGQFDKALASYTKAINSSRLKGIFFKKDVMVALQRLKSSQIPQ